MALDSERLSAWDYVLFGLIGVGWMVLCLSPGFIRLVME